MMTTPYSQSQKYRFHATQLGSLVLQRCYTTQSLTHQDLSPEEILLSHENQLEIRRSCGCQHFCMERKIRENVEEIFLGDTRNNSEQKCSYFYCEPEITVSCLCLFFTVPYNHWVCHAKWVLTEEILLCLHFGLSLPHKQMDNDPDFVSWADEFGLYM